MGKEDLLRLPPFGDSDARIKALEARTRELEQMAFSYSVLAEVSRQMNTFLMAEEMLSFALEIITECVGFAKGMILTYESSRDLLVVKCCKFFAQKESRTLEPLPSEEFLSLRFPADPDTVRELELSGNYVLPVEGSRSNPLLSKAFPGLLGAVEPLGMEVMLLLIHRGSLKGMVFLGERITGSAFQMEGNLLLLALADLTATCLETVRVRELAIIDDLTKLHTFSHFRERLESEIERSTRTGEEFSLIILDIDKFKMINDHYGHLTGDKMLRAVAMTLKGSVRNKVDLVGRYGGDEFLVLLPSTVPEDAVIVADRIRSQVARITTEKVNNPTISIGIASFPSHGATVDELIEEADKALYKAKRDGGNQVVTVEDVEFGELSTVKKPTAYRLLIRDKATKLFVGPYFLDRLEQEMNRARRYGRVFSLVAFGLSFPAEPAKDGDQFGMDEMLRILSLSIVSQIRREIDLPTRYSKGKVLLLLPETDQEGAVHFAVRIRHLLMSQLSQVEEEWGKPKMGMAVTAYPQAVEESQQLLEMLVKALDQAMESEGDQIGISEGDQIFLHPVEKISQQIFTDDQA